ncbi:MULTISPECIES: glutaredoxin family protein [Arsenicicoccus]|uniref:glutaredoxin family protein n=1 Tax=Arsenicicoccus TaxID=267408 RepID=UPI00040ED476|nr:MULTISPECIES: glutaredoxin family protein [Arsenicicoccus]
MHTDLTSARVVLLGRPGCHLCDVARATIHEVAGESGASVAEYSIDDDPDLRERYAEQIPVVFVDGRQHDYWRVDPARLRRALG